MTRTRANRVAWIGVAILTVVWSFNWTVMKVATRYSGPFTFSFERYAVATVALFAWLVLRHKRLKPTPWLPTIAIGLTQTAAFQALSQWALMSGGAGKVVLLAYTMPFWVVPLAWWWLHEKPGLARWVSIAIAAVGIVGVIEPWRPLGAPGAIGLALAAGIAWGVATVLSKRLFQHHPEVTPLQLTAWQMLIGTIGLAVLALSAREPAVRWNYEYVAAVLYSGLVASSVGWVLWALVVRTLPTHVAGLTSLAVPVAGVLFAWGLLAEAPSGPEWIGIVLIAGALASLNFAGRMRG